MTTSDSTNHIWLSPCSSTKVGRMLHIGALVPFDDPEYGRFASMYAFWYWYAVSTEDHLRSLHADDLVKSPIQGMPISDSIALTLHTVNQRRFFNNSQLLEQLLVSDLPFQAYDLIYSNLYRDWMVLQINELDWYVRSLEKIRQQARSHTSYQELSYG